MKAWLYLSTNPTCPIIFPSFASLFIILASLELVVKGFSTKMCLPLVIHFSAISK
jgi:hypothetical protein